MSEEGLSGNDGAAAEVALAVAAGVEAVMLEMEGNAEEATMIVSTILYRSDLLKISPADPAARSQGFGGETVLIFERSSSLHVKAAAH